MMVSILNSTYVLNIRTNVLFLPDKNKRKWR